MLLFKEKHLYLVLLRKRQQPEETPGPSAASLSGACPRLTERCPRARALHQPVCVTVWRHQIVPERKR